MTEILIIAGCMVGMFVLISAVMIVAIAWTHYPYGFLGKRRKKHEKNR